MKILITGLVAFVIWCFISAWLYNDILLPVIEKPVPVQPIPEPPSAASDSLSKIPESMPGKLMIYFEFDKVKFKTDPQTDNTIKEFKAWLDKYPSSMLSVTGHSDLVGTPDYNNELGLERARVVEKYLVLMGVPANKLIIESKGETEPAAGYITDAGRSKNRRTEISIKMK